MDIQGYANQIKWYRQTILLYRLNEGKETYRRDHRYSLTEVQDKRIVKDLVIRNVVCQMIISYSVHYFVIRTTDRKSIMYIGYPG